MTTYINYKGLEISVKYNNGEEKSEETVQTINRELFKHSNKVQSAKKVNDEQKAYDSLEYISFLSKRGLL